MNYIVELAKDTNEHELANSCALYLWQEVFRHDTRFYGSRAHLQALQRIQPALELDSFEPLHILPRKDGNKLQWIKIYMHEIRTAYRILRNAKREQVQNIVFLSLSSPTMFFVKKYARAKKLEINLFFTLHGDLQWLVQEDLGRSERFFRSLIQKNLSSVRSNEYYVVYGKTIASKLLTIFPVLQNQLIHLEHPFIHKQNSHSNPPNLLTIGAFGVISKHKNSHEVIKLAEIMRQRAPVLRFKLVGKFIDQLPYNSEIITVLGGRHFLSRQDYEKQIEETAWLMYLYEDRNYQLIASGAFLDAVLYNKPIICLRNSFFEDLFSGYEIGILVDTLEELPDALTHLFDRSDLPEFYASCQENIQRYSDDNKLSKQVAILKSQLTKLNYE